MSTRSPDLPDFGNPPVTEVVLGVQFGTLERLLAPHLGLVWSEFRDRYPEIEERPPLDPTYETFSEAAAGIPMPQVRLELLSALPTPRVFFINTDKTELLQVQRDRFLHNWRKTGEGGAYPRFERMLKTFEAGFEQLEAVIERESLGAIIPNQCEVSYINQITLDSEQDPFRAYARIFRPFNAELVLNNLGLPEDARFSVQYVLRESDTPIGRLYVSALPARKSDGTKIVQLTLVARGKPSSADLSGVSAFLNMGRHHIVRAFAELTTEEMHRAWERNQ